MPEREKLLADVFELALKNDMEYFG